ncbi:Factor arrest protein 11 [Conoideocrella luteorostrata]|uniref:Factor arrest protein 11 n=1 Tax=Conoideocrella luteorostrata TaxID=1105319 RepID=A0AAJ0FTG1_9HYPO|nr:Factor arrest protein 11 [Conoideocrella luteorostrata]
MVELSGEKRVRREELNDSDESAWSGGAEESIKPDLEARLNAQIAESLGLDVHQAVRTGHQPKSRDAQLRIKSKKDGELNTHEDQGHDDTDSELGEFEFRLFSSAAPSKIVLEDENAPLGEGALAHPRPPSFYAVKNIPGELKREYQYAAVSGHDIIMRSHRPSWGMELPWRVTKINIARQVPKAGEEDTAANLKDEEVQGKRKRPGKKSRIAARANTRKAREMEDARKKDALDKEEHLKEKKKRLNRAKKLRKKAKSKEMKGAEGSGRSAASGIQSSSFGAAAAYQQASHHTAHSGLAADEYLERPTFHLLPPKPRHATPLSRPPQSGAEKHMQQTMDGAASTPTSHQSPSPQTANMWPASAPVPEQAPEPPKPTEDVTDTGEVAVGGGGADEVDKPPVPPPPPPSRPGLQRNSFPAGLAAATGPGHGGQNVPQQQQQQQQQQQNPAPTDSLSLLQLRRIVAEVNRAEPVAYDFVYSDMGPHAEEIDEWFVYQFWQWIRLNAAQKAFEWHWNQESDGQHSWDDTDHDTRTRFVRAAIAGVQSNDAALKSASIGKIVYLVLGRWGDTAMPNATDGNSRSIASLSQLQAIKAGVECLTSLEGLPVIWEALRNCFELHWSGDIHQQTSPQEAQDELMNLMTIMYIAIQETLNDPVDMSSSYKALLELNPSLVDFMMTATSKLRWDEQNSMPLTQIFLLFWKSILLVFGGIKDLGKIKTAMSGTTEGHDKSTITASPLDYHVFRQEITSKYPAYVPPQPLIPLEDENTSLLPPLPNISTRNNGNNGIISTPGHAQSGGASILNQPVHIATPAPSPPPSPGVGGKSGKKQNYQTNQNFPFMYPPLDATSNSAGGKGMAGIDDSIVSRRWEGSDIPASILEAGELFSTRVRMTRAAQQMWEEREQFLKFERGWIDDDDDDFDGEIEDLDLDELTLEEREVIKEIKADDKPQKPKAKGEGQSQQDAEIDFGPHPDRLSTREKQRLLAVERFYRESLPHLQSLVIVLLRPILANVTAIVAQQAGQMPNGMAGRGSNPGMNGGPNGPRPPDMPGQIAAQEEPDPSPEEVDAARTREITSKATTGILILLLKWLRVSHVLKFEYLTQLLLDSNYVPLVLKLFAHQDVQQVVDSKMDRVENSFFQFCNLRSKFKDKSDSDLDNEDEEVDNAVEAQQKAHGGGQDSENDSEDDAVPPPIKRNRPPVVSETAQEEGEGDEGEEDGEAGDDQASIRPEVDELGYPVNPLPEEPITDFSWRNFFSLINYLRVLQKICKNKAHRNLLLVQYKSSTILRKSLRIPQPELRLYTLKLFKNQVPYCGRKWRQSNMRVITAVYLHCRPELRDEWLAGSDVDAEVDTALPLEQALRSLTHWLNVRKCPDKIAPDVRMALREEQDFFSRELEKLEGWGDERLDEMSELEHVEGWA